MTKATTRIVETTLLMESLTDWLVWENPPVTVTDHTDAGVKVVVMGADVRRTIYMTVRTWEQIRNAVDDIRLDGGVGDDMEDA